MPRATSHPRLYDQAQQARRRAHRANQQGNALLLLVLVVVALWIFSSCSATKPAGIRPGKFTQEPRSASPFSSYGH